MPLRAQMCAPLIVAAVLTTVLPQWAAADDTKAAPQGLPNTSASAAQAKPPADDATADPAQNKAARPPSLGPLPTAPLPWERTLDVGGDFAFVARPATATPMGTPSQIRYEAATGFALHVRWPIFKYLQIEGYFLDCHLPVSIPQGALGPSDGITSPPVETFVFGARISPKITWGRITGSLTAGVGWGRLEFQRMTATTQAGKTYTLRERGASFVEFPFGIGVSIEIVRKWLSFDLQATAAALVEQHGDAFDNAQTVNSAGKLMNVGPLPMMDASLVQTIGLSLLL